MRYPIAQRELDVNGIDRGAHPTGEATYGRWATEADSIEFLDRLIDASGMFSTYKEVRGHYTGLTPEQGDKTPRIDRLLFPSVTLRAQGWPFGVIGIEAKRSQQKIGPAIAQAMDYRRAVWTVPELGNITVHASWIFIWPYRGVGGAVASITAQNRIGAAAHDGDTLYLGTPSGNLAKVRWDGIEFRGEADRIGRKAGSR